MVEPWVRVTNPPNYNASAMSLVERDAMKAFIKRVGDLDWEYYKPFKRACWIYRYKGRTFEYIPPINGAYGTDLMKKVA